MTDGQSSPASLAAAGQLRGATIAFESIDGPPPDRFQALVRNLNDQAQSRRLAVMSRERPSAYRVRGYLSAAVVKNHSTISWVWDVFDRDEHRALRIQGEEIAAQPIRNAGEAWNAADDAMLRRIADSSMEQLAGFLTSAEAGSDASPATPVASTQPQDSSPETAGAGETVAARVGPDTPLPPRQPHDNTQASARAKPAAQRSASL